MSGGHSFDRKSFHVLGERTSVSQAATVRAQTKKYLCADRWGESLREFGRRAVYGGELDAYNSDNDR